MMRPARRSRDGRIIWNPCFPQGVDAHVEIWVRRPSAAEGGAKAGEFDVSASEGVFGRSEAVVDVPRIAKANGKEALFFVVSSPVKTRGVIDFADLRFETVGGN